MQFSTVAFFAAAAASVSAAANATVYSTESTLVTITSCESYVTDCPANTAANVTSYEGAANKQFAAGAVALAAGALLAL